MKILKVLFFSVVALAGALVLGGFLLPSSARVERSIEIAAAPAVVFTVLNGFRQFDQWSPWAGIDPQAVTTYAGPEAGVGARMSWSGNADVGTGSQEILESEPYRRIVVKLTFGDFGGDYRASYRLEPAGAGTRVTWTYDAEFGGDLLLRYFGLLSESMLGPDYERGLRQLKALVEALPAIDFSALEFQTVDTQAQPLLVMETRSANEPRAIGVALGVAYSRLSGAISAAGLRQSAPPRAIYRGEEDGVLRLEAAIPVDRPVERVPPGLRAGEGQAGRAVRAVYRGAYSGLPGAHAQAQAYLTASGQRTVGPRWEEYVSDPAQVPEAGLITHLYYPIE